MKATAFLLFAIVACSNSAHSATETATDFLAVGSPAFSAVQLQPYENVWRYTVTRADGTAKVEGLWSDRMDLIDQDGHKLMRRVQGMTYVNGLTSSTINIFNPNTMAAVSSEIHKVDGSWLKRSFQGTTVTEIRGGTPADKIGVTTKVTLPQPVFDYWGGMYGTLVAALPLRVGMTCTLPSMAEFDPRYETATFRVVREETLKAGALGDVRTFVVESEGMTFWLSAKTPYVLKLDVPMSEGIVAHWDEL